MESMDYNYFASVPQPYQFFGLDADATIIDSAACAVPSLETADAFSLGLYDFQAFDPSLASEYIADPQLSGSCSPTAQQLSTFPVGSIDSGIALDLENEHETGRGSSEEKESLTPAQSRRKAQNRAAQRAFRERKERHVRDLEAKLDALTRTTTTLQADNERLKLLLQRAQTENEVLKATLASSPSRHYPPSFVDDPSLLSPVSRDSEESPEPHVKSTRLAQGLLFRDSCSSRSSPGGSETHLLSASATWDLIQSHPLYLTGAVDIGEVCERLKKTARCDGMGPVFDEDEVRKAIEEVGRTGSDELI